MKAKGFSLVELLIAMALLGILSAIASFAWSHYNANLKLKAAARKVVADIVRYKNNAVAEQRDYTITFNVAANQYTISADANDALPAFNPPPVTPLTAAMVDADAHLTSVNIPSSAGANVVKLLQRGMLQLTGTDPGIITIQNSLAIPSTATINVYPNGRAYVTFDLH
jgi:prepilin-type N-terminal cleavage/methylation domain-containing protein